jgi:hypothetical protein
MRSKEREKGKEKSGKCKVIVKKPKPNTLL